MEALLIIAICSTLIWSSVAGVRAWWLRRRVHQSADHGREMEERAGQMLRSHGYRPISQHPEIHYIWTLGSRERAVTVTPDWLVERDGYRFLVEVKTGNQANPNQAKTRRQLLEYYLFGDADGVVYFDADRNKAVEVHFPTPIRRRTPAWLWITLVINSLITIFALWGWLSC